MTSRRAANGETQSFVCDNRNRITNMSWSNNADWATFGYDNAGRMTSANNPNSNVTLSYDATGRLSHDTQNVAGCATMDVTYTRNNDGRVTQVDVPTDNYNTMIDYDSMGRVWHVHDKWRPNMIEYTYDAASNVTQRYNYLNNTTLGLPRDNLGRLSGRSVTINGSTISSETYSYDLLNQSNTVDRTEDGERDQFGYDHSDQVTSAQYGLVGGANPQRTVSYSLDAAGNRSSLIDAGVRRPEFVSAFVTRAMRKTIGLSGYWARWKSSTSRLYLRQLPAHRLL